MPFTAGDAFLNHRSLDDSGEPDLPQHLWVIISDPRQQSSTLVIVNFTTWYPDRDRDPTCMVQDGEHPFVDHPTCVSYRDAQMLTANLLDRWLRDRKMISHVRVSEALLERIRHGAVASDFTPNEVLDFLREQGLID